jgi:hypothetical protein
MRRMFLYYIHFVGLRFFVDEVGDLARDREAFRQAVKRAMFCE